MGESWTHPEAYYEIGGFPSAALQAYGRVQDLKTEDDIAFDPWALTYQLQSTVLGYIADPPRTPDGYARWLVVLKSRQSGISTCTASGYYVKAQYLPGWTHVTSADKKERADMLFERVQYLHGRWPDDLKVPQISSNQIREYQWIHNGKMNIMSGAAKGMAIGAAASSWHWSEVPLWGDASKQWGMAYPAIKNRMNAQMVWESTPFPLSEPSSEFYMKLCQSAAARDGRFVFAFEPFWDGTQNARPWPRGQPLSIEEQRLLDQYGHLGLKPENLQFRRETIDDVPEIAENPDLFRVWFPFDDITCWLNVGLGVIKSRHLERHLRDLVPFDWESGYMEYQEPRADAKYVIGVDPAGFGGDGDHCSFQVLEVWAGSWRQVACYAGSIDPPEFNQKLYEVGRKYNDALILIERNGVGVSALTTLINMEYPNLFWETNEKPGLNKSSGAEAVLLAHLIEALKETLVLRDKSTVEQMQGYRRDRAMQRTIEAQLLSGGRDGRRRSRHHWDKVSAMMYAVMAARTVPQRSAPSEMRYYTPDGDPVMTENDLVRYKKRMDELFRTREKPRRNVRRTYSRRRRAR